MTASSGVTALNNLTTASVVVCTGNVSRKKLVFHNPNIETNVDVMICPTTDVEGNALAATYASPGGGIPIFPGSYYEVKGLDLIRNSWRAAARSGTTTALTIVASDRE